MSAIETSDAVNAISKPPQLGLACFGTTRWHASHKITTRLTTMLYAILQCLDDGKAT